MVRNARNVRMFDRETGEEVSSGLWAYDFRKGQKVRAGDRLWTVWTVTELPSASGNKHLRIELDLVVPVTREEKPTPPWVPLKLRVLRERHRKEELALVLEALDSADWSAAGAARLIGIDPNTMRSMIRSHKLAKEWRKRKP